MLLINLISLYLLFAAGTVIFCAVQIRTLNGANYTRTALLLCFAICFYILGYCMELNASAPSQIQFWNRIEYIGIPFVSALWLTTALIYTGHFSRHRKLLLFAIYGIPAATLVLRLTNDFHHLYFASVQYVEEYGKLFFIRQVGPWMYVQMVHSALMIVISMGLFLYDSVSGAEKERGKILLIISASVFAVAGLLFIKFKPLSYPIDYMTLCLPVTSVMVILAISRYDLLETKSVARSKVFEASSDAILLLNRRNRLLDYNNSAKRLFEAVGIRPNGRYSAGTAEGSSVLLEGLEKTGPSVIKLRIKEEERYYDITTETLDNHTPPRGWIKTIRDVTEIYQLNHELKKQAMTDELSVLSNRRAFLSLGKEWVLNAEESGASLYLLMIDLDHFKNVNDRYGHPTGDLVIRDIARILKEHFPADSLVARLGGEEFAVLLSGFDDDGVLRMLDVLQEDAERHVYSYFGEQFHVTISAGATKKQPGETLEGMMQKADRALYQSKNRGRNRFTVL